MWQKYLEVRLFFNYYRLDNACLKISFVLYCNIIIYDYLMELMCTTKIVSNLFWISSTLSCVFHSLLSNIC